MDWKQHAAALARATVHPSSRWYGPTLATPRHLCVPRWYEASPEGWRLADGPADEALWARAAYADRTLVTKAGPVHADHAPVDDPVIGRPTSSSTLPSLVVKMLSYGRLPERRDVLDVATGSGYSAALACAQLGDNYVTTVDVDPYLTAAAAERLDAIGHRPKVLTQDAAEELPGTYDRIVSMVSVPRIPLSWMRALRPEGRLVTTIAGTGLILTADKNDDGGATGRIEWDRAAFMATRTGDDYPPQLDELFQRVRDIEGDEVTASPFPVLDVMQAWEVWSMLSLTAPGIEHRTGTSADGGRMAWMFHPDGSWARAHTESGSRTTTVHQGGPRRLYTMLEAIRWRWIEHGELPVYGARVTIDAGGATTLSRGGWSITF
ncbi:methyltransferase domain-containing protein [Streptomyces europaeiscabiei]|uniref:methyltransferase domain-containing protein n=1 Tax=Streptomyces europaeiscabiei TaxID=146819 RepID=UPI0029AC630C|nr:methyltransferase domain-containing protein [Streptomyces europaeiscabiei]MDX3672674.1 methyltransferase domain-containing protein [Streptomyces europaeiscabiei]